VTALAPEPQSSRFQHQSSGISSGSISQRAHRRRPCAPTHRSSTKWPSYHSSRRPSGPVSPQPDLSPHRCAPFPSPLPQRTCSLDRQRPSPRNSCSRHDASRRRSSPTRTDARTRAARGLRWRRGGSRGLAVRSRASRLSRRGG